ncbi:hypothetical protein MMC11_006074 [Xylographa trunciseda]|nr:hypothetical protein [Xylographa trunciseda]
MSSSPPQPRIFTFTPPYRPKPKGKKRDSNKVEQLELPIRVKKHKSTHKAEQAEGGPSTTLQPEFSALITIPDNLAPSPVRYRTSEGAFISSVDQRTLSPLSTMELLNFMRVDMSIHVFSSRQHRAYHGSWFHHTNAPRFPATLGPLPLEPSDTTAYVNSVIRAATEFIRWQLADLTQITDRGKTEYTLFEPFIIELAALQKLQAMPNVSLNELVRFHYPSPPLTGNLALFMANTEDLIDELNRYQFSLIDEDFGCLYPPPTLMLPVEDRHSPEAVAILMGQLTEAYGLDVLGREDRREFTEQADTEQVLSLQDTQIPPPHGQLEQEQVLSLQETPVFLPHEQFQQEHGVSLQEIQLSSQHEQLQQEQVLLLQDNQSGEQAQQHQHQHQHQHQQAHTPLPHNFDNFSMPQDRGPLTIGPSETVDEFIDRYIRDMFPGQST